MTEGILRIPRKLPTNQREWEQFTQRLNQGIQHDGERIVLSALATIAERNGTNLDTILQHIGDGGRANNQQLMPMVNFGNVASVQSTDPLTAVAGATTADITVSAHTLHTDFGDISYNSGSILGLALNTRYYIYVQDPNNAGGAVTYIASTSKPNITANSGRYFVGTIVTPVAANSANIDNATSANPIVIRTTTAHGWSSGDSVQLGSLPGDFGTNLNGTIRTITAIDSDEFSIAVDGTAYAAYTSGGTATRIVDDGIPDWGGGGGGYLP